MARASAAQLATPVQRETPIPASDLGVTHSHGAAHANMVAQKLLPRGEQRLLPLKEVLALVSISRATIYRYLNAGLFPPPVRIGKRRIAWRASDINTWFENL